MKAIVLAAGFATRMYPLTRDRAKPLLDVGGRPVLSWILDRVLEVPEVDEVVVVTNGRFEEQFEAWCAGYEARVPVRVISDGTTDNESLSHTATLTGTHYLRVELFSGETNTYSLRTSISDP